MFHFLKVENNPTITPPTRRKGVILDSKRTSRPALFVLHIRTKYRHAKTTNLDSVIHENGFLAWELRITIVFKLKALRREGHIIDSKKNTNLPNSDTHVVTEQKNCKLQQGRDDEQPWTRTGNTKTQI